ncbi:MAG: DUF58 domain-containing protein [Bacillota bacterium]
MNNSFINFIIILFVLFGFIGGFHGASLVVVTSMFFLLIILLAKYWNRFAFSHLKIDKNVSRDKVEFGEKIYYSIQLENRKMLPLLWLRFEDYINENIEFTAKELISNSLGRNLNILKDNISLKWFEKVKRSYEITPKKRGLYYFGKGNIYFNGILGLFQNKLELSHTEDLIVYPQIVPVKFFDINESFIFGSSPKKGWIYKDPLNKVGVRPYQTTDSTKDINWKASARHLQLESNVYEPSYNKEIHLFLYSSESHFWWEQKPGKELELAITCAASLVDRSLREDLRVGFYSNFLTSRGFDRNYIEINPGKNIKQRERILTAMALIRPFSIKKPGYLIREKQNSIKKGATVIIITFGINDSLKKLLYNYNKYYNLIVIKVNKNKGKNLKGIKEFFLEKEGDQDEIEKLELV